MKRASSLMIYCVQQVKVICSVLFIRYQNRYNMISLLTKIDSRFVLDNLIEKSTSLSK